MKHNQQINHRNRLSNYYRYLIQKVENDEPFAYFKVITNESPTKAPTPSLTEARTISYSEKKSSRYQSQKQVSKVQVPEGSSPRVKLPPISKHSSVIERKEGMGVDWEKYYNVHNLSTVNIDEGTIKLIQENHRRSKLKKSISINQQRSDA